MLAIGGVIATSGLLPTSPTALVIQSIIGFLGAYGIHEVANDQPPATTLQG